MVIEANIMYEEICYEAPFLKEVILRVDFPSPLDGVERSLSKKVMNAALSSFPISEPQKSQTQELQFSGEDVQSKTSEAMQWVFFGEEREKTLIIEPSSVVQTSRRYTSHEDFIESFDKVISAIFEDYKEATASRVGLRYINLLDIKEQDALSWT
jgi:uncharacterized protein (TIGR04255 family)